MGTALPRLAPACGGWAWRGKWGPSVAPAISQIQAPSRVSREVKNGAGADTRLEKRLKNRSRSIQLVGWWQLRPLTALWVLTLTLKVVAVILDKRNSVSFQLYSCFLLFFFPQKIMLTFSRNITFFFVSSDCNNTSFTFSCNLVIPSILLHKYTNAHSICRLFRELPEEKISYGKAFSWEASPSKWQTCSVIFIFL